MFGLLLFSLCVAGWAASTPTGDITAETPNAHEKCPCAALRVEDVAHLLADVRNSSEGETTVMAQMEQLSHTQKTQTLELNEGLREVRTGLQHLTEVLSPLLQDDGIFGRDAFIRELLGDITGQESQMQDLRREGNRTAAAMQRLEDDDQTLQQELDLSLRAIQQRGDAIEQVKLSIRETNEENQQLLAKANATAVETLSRRGEMQALRGQLTQLKALYAQKQATRTQLEQQYAELESNKNEIQQEVAQLEKKAKIIKNVIVVPNDEKTDLQQLITWLKEGITKKETEITQLQIAIAQLNGTITHLVTENELQSNRRETIKEELKGLQVSLNSLRSKKDQQQEILAAAEREQIRSCTNISEALQTRTSLNENLIREQQEANAQLEAKRMELKERISQARITKQRLQEQLLQLQTDELQLKHEEVQIKTKNLETKSALQKAVGEEAQLNSEIGLLEQQLQLAKERDQHIETLVDILKQNVTQAISAKDTLIQNKNDQANVVTSLSQTLNDTAHMVNHLSQECNQLREKQKQLHAAGQSLKETKQHLEQKRSALATQRAELSASVHQVTEEKERLLLNIETLNMDLDQIEFNLRKAEQDLSTCDRLSDIDWIF